MNKEDLTLALVKAKIDPEVKKNPELLALIEDPLAELKKDRPVNLISAKFNRSLTVYLLGHQLKAPQIVIDLHKLMAAEAAAYEGRAFSSIMLGSILGGGGK
ncbi:bacteriocin immunity protein [Streptococcus panodentis]|uniref:Bacteriocin immunity protein n=1 Tax=Streptococcus panodentis TaxID=1581472 RepID=A0ABS5B0S3_9STRE|nr:bacteriocin immunity protein [Streptococcus panodentis]MBP2622106.1 hypothetical protein [Streptococcus panodentis]